MDYLWLLESQANELVALAIQEAPKETCGLIAGRNNRAERIIPIKNIADDPEHFFYLDPKQLAHILPELHAQNLEILSYFHSHPHGKPIPSSTDIDNADSGSVHTIIGLAGKRPEIAVWEIKHFRVTSIDLHVGITQPAKKSLHITRAQHYAILISTLLAFIIMLIISLSLLPPAPPIP